MDAASLEQAPGYRHTVQRGPDGLREVNTGEVALANTAHIAAMARKLDEVQDDEMRKYESLEQR